jgi:hypothetical protein
VALFNVSGLLLIAEHCNGPLRCRYLHTQELLSYGCIEFVHESSAKNREIRMIDVNDIESEVFCLDVVKISEGDREQYLSNWLDWLPSETL